MVRSEPRSRLTVLVGLGASAILLATTSLIVSTPTGDGVTDIHRSLQDAFVGQKESLLINKGDPHQVGQWNQQEALHVTDSHRSDARTFANNNWNSGNNDSPSKVENEEFPTAVNSNYPFKPNSITGQGGFESTFAVNSIETNNLSVREQQQHENIQQHEFQSSDLQPNMRQPQYSVRTTTDQWGRPQVFPQDSEMVQQMQSESVKQEYFPETGQSQIRQQEDWITSNQQKSSQEDFGQQFQWQQQTTSNQYQHPEEGTLQQPGTSIISTQKHEAHHAGFGQQLQVEGMISDQQQPAQGVWGEVPQSQPLQHAQFQGQGIRGATNMQPDVSSLERNEPQIAMQPNQAQQEQRTNPIPIGIPNGALPQCGVNLPEERHVIAAWTASYPGSGAKLTWKLVRGITGLWTSDDHDHNGRVASGLVAAVKTHFPSHTPPEVFFKPCLRQIQQAVLLMRNPLASIPSYHNFLYEQMNNLRNHSTRAPIEVWLKWRDAFFENELRAWVDHAQFWIDNYAGRFFLLAFEHLTSDSRGVTTLAQLSTFFAEGDVEIAKGMVPAEQLPCIWQMYVKGTNLGSVEAKNRHSHREGGPTEYPYTNLQLDTMIAAIRELRNANQSVLGLNDLLNEYIDLIESKQVEQDSNMLY